MNSITIHLDAGLNATLDFTKEKELAREAIVQGFKLNFEIDFGLFSNLKKKLSNSSQCLSFKLSLEQFKEAFFHEFEGDIERICLYKGNLNFSHDARRDDDFLISFREWQQSKNLDVSYNDPWYFALFCRDVFTEYLHILIENMPDALAFHVELDCSLINDPLLYAVLTHREVYQRLHLKLTNSPYLHDNQSCYAICLPSKDIVLQETLRGFSDVFNDFIKNNIAYRLIPESMLITEWHLVDYLFVLTNTITAAGKRKLQGFAAAGGIVVLIGDKIGIPGEMTYSEFLMANI